MCCADHRLEAYATLEATNNNFRFKPSIVYANGVTFISPGSRSAPWVYELDITVYAEGVVQMQAAMKERRFTPSFL